MSIKHLMHNGLFWNLFKSTSHWMHHFLRSHSHTTGRKNLWLCFDCLRWTKEYCLKLKIYGCLFCSHFSLLFLIRRWDCLQPQGSSEVPSGCFGNCWKATGAKVPPTVLASHWRMALGYRDLLWLLCHFGITGDGAEKEGSVLTSSCLVSLTKVI